MFKMFFCQAHQPCLQSKSWASWFGKTVQGMYVTLYNFESLSLVSHVQPQPLCPSPELMNLAAWWKWNLDDVDTKFPKNSIPNWFLTQIYHHTTNGNHPYPGVLALVVYFHFGWEKNHETTFPKSLPTFRLPVVMALTVGTRVAGILIPKRTCCDLFHLCWIAWLFSYFEVCLVCTTCQSHSWYLNLFDLI